MPNQYYQEYSTRPARGHHFHLLLYVASLTTRDDRRSMRQALEKIAHILSGGQASARDMDWAALRFQHTQAIRTALVEAGYTPATINKALSALRGTLRAAWQMGQMDAESYWEV